MTFVIRLFFAHSELKIFKPSRAINHSLSTRVDRFLLGSTEVRVPKYLFSFFFDHFRILINRVSLGKFHKIRIQSSCQFR